MNKAADGSCKALQQLGNQSSTSGEHNWGFNCDMFYSPLCLDAEITTWICFLCACAAGQTQNDFENKQRTISFSIKLKIRDGAVMLLLLKYLQKVTAFCLGSTKIRLETLMGWGIVKKKKKSFRRFLWDFGALDLDFEGTCTWCIPWGTKMYWDTL